MNPDEVQFEADLAADRATSEPALVVDVEGFEGPLDLAALLLELLGSLGRGFAEHTVRVLGRQLLIILQSAA